MVATEAGINRVLKVLMPNDMDVTAEIAGLKAARGHGYASLVAVDEDNRLIVLEQLGKPLAQSAHSPLTQIQIITKALMKSWQGSTAQGGLVDGEKKADWLENHIKRTPIRLHHTVDGHILGRALELIAERRNSWREEEFVLVHGDAHEHNALAVLNGAADDYKLVDPDGLRFEAAYDLGILLRNCIETYRDDAPAQLFSQRASWLSEHTQVPSSAIKSWGFVEIVSTGIHLLKLGYAAEAQDYLQLSEALVAHV